MAQTGQRLLLPSGREIGYDEHGPATGMPILFFHGTPSSRFDWYLFGSQALAERLNVRVIAPDRPGLGLSDYQPDRQIIDWPSDVAGLADALGLERFALLGYSGGGPYVLACALRMPERLTAAGIVSGTGPYDGFGSTAGIVPGLLPLLALVRDGPHVSEMVFQVAGVLSRRLPPWFITPAMVAVSSADRRVLREPAVRQAFLSAFAEALRTGPSGARLDTALMVSPWGFDPRQICMPVRFWHGEDDRIVFPSMVRGLAAALPLGRAVFYPGEGHVSVLVNRAEDLLRCLVADAALQAA